MFGSDVLEVALGLTLFFLLASLMATAIRELIEAVLKTRAMDLERGVRELLDDPRGVAMAKSFFDHAHIFSLFRGVYDPAKLKSAGLLRRFLPTRHALVKDQVGFEMPLGARRSLPTYIPAGQFATAVIDLVGRGSGSWPYPVSSEALTLDLLRQRAAGLSSPRLQRAVLSAIDHADGELSKAKANLEAWFNGSMDRVSGAYKRRTQAWLVVIGLAIAVMFNLDAITVAQRLIDDPALRAAAAAHAEKLVAEEAARKKAAAEEQDPTEQERDKAVEASKTAPPPLAPAVQPKTVSCPVPCPTAPAAPPTSGTDPKGDANQTTPAGPPSQSTGSIINDFKKTSDTVEGLKNDLTNIGYPIGWRYLAFERAKGERTWTPAALGSVADEAAEKANRQRKVVPVPAPQTCESLTKSGGCMNPRKLETGDWAGVVLGWLITAVAISLGAPFWFDMLNKVMVVRSTVKPTEKSKDEGSEDRKPSPPSSGGAPPPTPPGPTPKPASPARPKSLKATAGPASPPTASVPGFEPETWKSGHTNPGEVL